MDKLTAPPTSPGSKLSSIVERYNALPDDADVEKLFYLQQINFFFRQSPVTPELITWRNMHGKKGLEAHLQRYGIHRDSSSLLQSIEFAKAIHRYAPATTVADTSIFSAMRERDALLKTTDLTTDIRTGYIAQNKAILDCYLGSPALQEKAMRHLHFLSLSYAKIDAIQGEVAQRFPEYKTSVLGNPEGNNKNFVFSVAGESEKMVIRVEDRHDLGSELTLQTHAVSEYFSDDYATFMMPFIVDETTEYRPVVISEFASEGDLATYAKKLTGKTKDEIAAQAQPFFTKLSDFCIKLIDSGHYHPDIKLSNFLTDGTRIIVSDRKTITDKMTPRVSDIESSPIYAAPEYQECITVSGSMNHVAARRTILNMPAYMSYQIGMALKEFMQGESGINDEDLFLEWSNIAERIASPTERIKNIGVLIQELTRVNPDDRLPLTHLHTLLAEVNSLSSAAFMARLEELWPKSGLSTHESIDLIEQVLTADHLTPDLRIKLDAMAKIQDVSSLGHDPRANFAALMIGKPLTHIKRYLDEIEQALLAADTAKASAAGHSDGGIPRVTTLAELGTALPRMSDIARACFELNEELHQNDFPGLSNHEQARAKEAIRIMESMSTTIRSAVGAASAVSAVTPFWATSQSARASTRDPVVSGTMIIHDDTHTDSPDEEDAGSGTMIVHDEDNDSGTRITHTTRSTTSDDALAIGTPPGSPTSIASDLTIAHTESTQRTRTSISALKARKPAAGITPTIEAGDAETEPTPETPPPGVSR